MNQTIIIMQPMLISGNFISKGRAWVNNSD